MKSVILLFACVALRNFANVGAMDNPNPRPGSGATNYRIPHPDIGPWNHHNHNHPTGIQEFLSSHSDLPRRQIVISKVLSDSTASWHILEGELVSNPNIGSCNGPHGYAIVKLINREPLYACVKPYLSHNESVNMRHAGDPPVYLASILREGQPILEADLVPSNQRIRLNSQDRLFHGDGKHRQLRLRRRGHVRFVKGNEIDVDGDLYEYPIPL